jgi:uncharacterized protein (TIGR03083 family)
VPTYIEQLNDDGQKFLAAARSAGPESAVPTCPNWRVTHLVRHLTFVHRWAVHYVDDRIATFEGDVSETDIINASSHGEDLWTNFSTGLDTLVRTLRSAPDDLVCWTFLPSPSPKSMWSRRQAHETSIHRVDAELAAGHTVGASPTSFSIDGIDELLTGFLGRPTKERSVRGVISVMPTDSDAQWTIDLTERQAHGSRGSGTGDVTIRGTATDIYYALWNRRPITTLDCEGEIALLDGWRDQHTVTW